GRVDAGGPDEQIAAMSGELVAAGPVAEDRRDALLVLLKAVQVMAGHDGVGTETPASCVEQDHLQDAPVDGVLRPAEAGGEAERILHDLLAMAGHVLERARLDRVRRQRPPQAEVDPLARWHRP